MKKNLVFTMSGIILLVLSILISLALIQSKPVPPSDAKRKAVLTVKAETVNYEKLKTQFSHQGRVEALESVSLAAEVNGKILQGDVPFKEGQNFNAGDLLVKIYDDDAAVSLKAARSNFLRTLSQILPDMMIDFPESYQTWHRFFNTIDLQKPLPEMPEIKNEKEKIFLASQNVLSEYYALKQQEINFKKYSVFAPFTGYFKQVNREVGSIAANGSELAVIVRSDALEIVSPVFPADVKQIRPAQTVTIQTKSGHTCEGKVSRVAQFVDKSTQSVNVYIFYQPTQTHSLLEGEFVTVNFQTTEAVKGLRIPREALVDDQFVYQVKNKKLEKVAVNVRQTLEDYIVMNGIPEGSVVVTESLVNAREGIDVKVRN